jgi:hypothetical protein
MPSSTGTRIAIFLSAAIALVAVWVTSGKFDLTYTRAIVSASSVVIMGLLAFDSWAWRFWPFRLILRKPILHGTWKVEQRTSYEPRAHQTIEAYLVIEQAFSGIRQVRGLYEISNSHSLTADLSVDRSHCALSFIFRSEAGTMHRDEKPALTRRICTDGWRAPTPSPPGRLLDGARHEGRYQVRWVQPEAEFASHVAETSTPAVADSRPE